MFMYTFYLYSLGRAAPLGPQEHAPHSARHTQMGPSIIQAVFTEGQALG